MKVSVTPWRGPGDPMRVNLTIGPIDAAMLALRLAQASKLPSFQAGTPFNIAIISADLRVTVTVDPKEKQP